MGVERSEQNDPVNCFANGDVYIKELGNKCLPSHNEKYKSIRIGENDSGYCCGRVIGVL